MITIVDYGMGNLRSVAKAFEHLGFEAQVTQRPDAVASARKVVLPGVGAFQDAVRNLNTLGLTAPLLGYLRSERPFLGICLGLQLLFTESEESDASASRTPGLGVLSGRVRRFPNGSLKIPHMGWNRIQRTGHSVQGTGDRMQGGGCPLLEGIPDGAYFYFVHSYFVEAEEPSVMTAQTDYGVTFTSMVWKERLFATQFHPEKSQKVGLKLLENFGRL